MSKVFPIILLTDDVASCDSNPCTGSETCLNRQRYYVCQCQSGYTGQHCQSSKMKQHEVFDQSDRNLSLNNLVLGYL